MVEEELEQLKSKDIPRPDLEDIMNLEHIYDRFPEVSNEQIKERLQEYLEAFIDPNYEEVISEEEDNNNYVCVNCKSVLAGFLRGQFRWKLRHGEGECSNCGYPMRGKHYVKLGEDESGADIEFSFKAILQYQPSNIETGGK